MMSQSDANSNDVNGGTGKLPRRGFLKHLTTAVGTFLVWRQGDAILRDSVVDTRASFGRTPNQNSLSIQLPQRYAEYPKPTYVPDGYQLSEIFTERPDGFSRPGDGHRDSTEISFWFINPKHPLGSNNPLALYVTQQPQHMNLGTVEGRKPAPMVLSMASGDDVQAKYHDGFWVFSPNTSGELPAEHVILPDGYGVLTWESSNLHSLTFKRRGFTIGVRGSRLAGIDLDELVRIASSMR